MDTKLLYNLKYESNKNFKYVYYYDCLKYEKLYNFGDYITLFIYEKIFLKKPILDINGGINKNDVLIGAGSILSKSKSNSIIWGTGFIKYNSNKIPKPKKILSVRGPLTRNILLQQKIECPEKYGDIGLILPYFYYPNVKKKYKLGIIPHYIDQKKFNELYKNKDSNIKIIDVTNQIPNVIEDILSCEMTISSSLHGIIVSHAYNRKCMWIKLSNKIVGGNFKFRDYYGSLKMNNYKNMLPYIFDKQISTNEIINSVNKYPNPSFPINTKSIIELCPFINIKNKETI